MDAALLQLLRYELRVRSVIIIVIVYRSEY